MKKNFLTWLVIAAVALILVDAFYNPAAERMSGNSIAFSDFMNRVDADEVSEVELKGNTIYWTDTNGKKYTTLAAYDANLISDMRAHNVKITVVPDREATDSLWAIFISWFPMILLIAVWIFFMRQMQGGGKAMSFGKSRARMMGENQTKITFADVAGIDEAKQELEEIVDFLKDPAKFQRLGGKIPKGVLLVGSPGTGKTLLARAIAGEASVPFFTISGSDFVEMFVGVGASRVRDMFEQGKKNAPCIIFIDEIDAVGRHRGAGLGGGNDEREQTLNQLLVEMDGFEGNLGVILVAATNRPDVLDPALLRPGRFDRQVVVPLPDITGREKILQVHLRKVPTAPDVDVSVIARGTPGFSGADLANVVNEAALLAARRNKRVVTMEELEYAKDKVMMGAERKSMVMDEAEKKMTAYHEAGHAICNLNCPEADPIHKATIIPRGQALGMVMQLPEKDVVSHSVAKLKDRLVVAFGGRVAEEIIFGKDKVSTGASSDIRMATNIARRMVTEFGMSDKMGPIAYEEPEGEVFLGSFVTKRKNMADETALNVDKEIHKIIDEAFKRAYKILTEKRQDLETLAQGLIEYETLSGEEIKNLLKGKKPERNNAPIIVMKSSLPETEDASEGEPAENSAASENSVNNATGEDGDKKSTDNAKNKSKSCGKKADDVDKTVEQSDKVEEKSSNTAKNSKTKDKEGE